MYNPKSVLENETHKFLWDFEIQTDDIISVRRHNKQKKDLPIIAFAVPTNHTVKLKERGINMYTFLENINISWNMKVTVIPIVIGALGTIHKGLVKELEDFEIR